jgi:4-amino-4-deoxy-L-arabinose transferase-like glycosyltransferase
MFPGMTPWHVPIGWSRAAERWGRLAPILLVLLAAAATTFRLSDSPLWNDEAFSFYMAQGGPLAAAHAIAQDTQPPVYYMALSICLWFGDGAVALRLMSALAAALAVFPLYYAAKRLYDTPTAVVAGLLFALAPFAVYWAQRARPYALQTLFLAIAFWGFAEVYRAAAARDAWVGQGIAAAIRTRRVTAARTDFAWLAVALGGGLAMLTQQPAGFFLLGLNAAVLLEALPRLRANRRWLLNWMIAQLALIGVWLLWLPWFIAQVTSNLTPDKIAARHPNYLIDTFYTLGNLGMVFGIASLWRAAPVFFVLVVGTAVFGVVLLARARRSAIPVLVPIVVPITVCVLGSWLIHPVFGYIIQYYVFIWIPYAILIGYAIAHMKPRRMGLAILTLIVLGEVWGLRNYYRSPHQPIREVAMIIQRRMQPGDGVILAHELAMRWGLAYYLRNEGSKIPDGLDVSSEWDFHRLIRTPEAALSHRRDWVVLPKNDMSSVSLALLRKRMRLAYQDHLDGADVMLFEAPTR